MVNWLSKLKLRASDASRSVCMFRYLGHHTFCADSVILTEFSDCTKSVNHPNRDALIIKTRDKRIVELYRAHNASAELSINSSTS
jgi:hypothetical protein